MSPACIALSHSEESTPQGGGGVMTSLDRTVVTFSIEGKLFTLPQVMECSDNTIAEVISQLHAIEEERRQVRNTMTDSSIMSPVHLAARTHASHASHI